jgi:fructose-1,6-bisphosphatase II / sedoheptulose-1,7-bisphosphatase
MSLDKKYIDLIANITSKGAISAANFIGKKDKISADQAAVNAMRIELNKLNIDGRVVIGEGELDEAPMLYIGEKVGTGNGLSIDIAVDPLEGTNFVANNMPGSLSVISIAEKGNLFQAPETYMNKIAYGKNVPVDAIDLDFSIEKNINNLAEATNKNVNQLTVCILDRPRHKDIINKLIRLKVKLKLITDGDVSGALFVTDEKYNVDLFLGIGGGPEGVLAACALDAFKCKFQGRFIFKNSSDIERAKKMGILDLNKKYNLNEIVKGDSIFCATGITSGDLVNGVIPRDKKHLTETLVTHKHSSMTKIIVKEIL